jgi:hypothetical protein
MLSTIAAHTTRGAYASLAYRKIFKARSNLSVYRVEFQLEIEPILGRVVRQCEQRLRNVFSAMSRESLFAAKVI